MNESFQIKARDDWNQDRRNGKWHRCVVVHLQDGRGGRDVGDGAHEQPQVEVSHCRKPVCTVMRESVAEMDDTKGDVVEFMSRRYIREEVP